MVQLNEVWKENQFKLRVAEQETEKRERIEICIKIQFSWQNNLLWQTTYLLLALSLHSSHTVFSYLSNWFPMEMWNVLRASWYGEEGERAKTRRYWIWKVCNYLCFMSKSFALSLLEPSTPIPWLVSSSSVLVFAAAAERWHDTIQQKTTTLKFDKLLLATSLSPGQHLYRSSSSNLDSSQQHTAEFQLTRVQGNWGRKYQFSIFIPAHSLSLPSSDLRISAMYVKIQIISLST